MCFIKNDAIPFNVVKEGIRTIMSEHGMVCSDDNGGSIKLFKGSIFFIEAMIHENFVTGGAKNFGAPLIEDNIGQYDECFGYKMYDKCGDHHDGLTEAHFVGDDTSIDGWLAHFFFCLFISVNK